MEGHGSGLEVRGKKDGRREDEVEVEMRQEVH